MHKFKIYPYKMASQSAKALAVTLDAKRIKPEGTYRPHSNHIIINWGNSHPLQERLFTANWLNLPHKVERACNKLYTFQVLKEANVSVPEFTTEKEVAKLWLTEGHIVFARESLTGNSGQGILLMQDSWIETRAQLFTKYTKCKHEYRVHVMNDKIIDIIQKKKRMDITPEQEQHFNPHIRSHQYGWIFARENIQISEKVKQEALKAIQALSLDFGAVDIGYRECDNQVFVYEVNTAPGLEGTTLERYTNAFKEYLNDRN